MLKRIYIDNFRCFANFELHLDRLDLLLGSNGTGKSSLFDALRALQRFIIGDARVRDVFPVRDLTRWQSRRQQRFELDIAAPQGLYRYLVRIEHDAELRRASVAEESLTLDGTPLFSFKEGVAQLYGDDGAEGPRYPFDWTLSGIGALHERPESRMAAAFKRELGKLLVVRPMPPLMRREGRGEQPRPEENMENFVSWYRYLAQEHMGAMMSLLKALEAPLPGFHSMSLKESGEDSRALKIQLAAPGDRPTTFDFGELSDGQKMLIALYTLLICLKSEGVSLFIDEPDNFLALREIQPWLSELADEAGESLEQAVLISHHPEVIDYLGVAHGRLFERDAHGPVRICERPKVDGLTLAEILARGWEK